MMKNNVLTYLARLSMSNPFYYLQNTDMSDNEELLNINRSFYAIVKTSSMILLIIGALIAIAYYSSTSNANRRREQKNILIMKFVMIIVLFSIPFILTIIYDLARAFA